MTAQEQLADVRRRVAEALSTSSRPALALQEILVNEVQKALEHSDEIPVASLRYLTDEMIDRGAAWAAEPAMRHLLVTYRELASSPREERAIAALVGKISLAKRVINPAYAQAAEEMGWTSRQPQPAEEAEAEPEPHALSVQSDETSPSDALPVLIRNDRDRMSIRAYPPLESPRLQGAPAEREPEVGQIYVGRVVNIVDFGAFVDVMGRDGLVHISEIQDSRVDRIADVLAIGQIVRVKVLEIDSRGRIRLSMRLVDQETGAELEDRRVRAAARRRAGMALDAVGRSRFRHGRQAEEPEPAAEAEGYSDEEASFTPAFLAREED
jgi:predicted RNA-binding protein with RPS1 domain